MKSFLSFLRRPATVVAVAPRAAVGSAPKGRIRKRMVAGTAAAALAVAFVGGKEGRSLVTYRDVVGVPTACFGETRGIEMGMTFTPEQCNAMLLKGLSDFEDDVYKCVPGLAGAPDERLVAHISLSYNIGAGPTASRPSPAGTTPATSPDPATPSTCGTRPRGAGSRAS